MENKSQKLIEQYNKLLNGFEQQQFISNEWPIENGVYRQYSALDSSENSVSGTSFCL